MLLLCMAAALQIAPAAGGLPVKQPQLAARGAQVALVYGAGNAVFFVGSTDSGKTFGNPVLVSAGGPLALGMHRGPRVAFAKDAIVVSAIVGEKGKGQDGDLLAWRSTDGGRTWSPPVRVNDVVGAPREGLHAMAASGGLVFAAWLDLRAPGMRVYGASSTDGGATWSANRLVYASPSGDVCTCCHPSVAIDAAGQVLVMFRNALGGSRDLYLARSTDGGKTFATPAKLGQGTWKLEACPMDGGDLAVAHGGRVSTVWRREDTVFESGLEGPETRVATGRNPALAVTKGGDYRVWTDGKAVMLRRPGAAPPEVIAPDGAFPALAALEDGSLLAAWESNGTITARRLD
jgi:BNR repeat protein